MLVVEDDRVAAVPSRGGGVMLKIVPNADVVIPGVTEPGEPTKAQLRGVFCNPLLTGVGPFPRRVSDKEWIHLARREMRDNGTEQFLVNMLHVMRETFSHSVAVTEETPKPAEKT